MFGHEPHFDHCCDLLPSHAPPCVACSSLPHVARHTCAACSSLLSPTRHAPHLHLSPRFGHAPRRPLPPIRRLPPMIVVLVHHYWIPPQRPELTSSGLPLPYIANVCFKCFRYFKGMMQLLHMNVAKVYRDVAHVAYLASVTEVCCKRLFKMFYLFQMYVVATSVLSGYCICFTYMLQEFYLDVAYVSHICSKCFIWMCQMYIASKCFMLQVFHGGTVSDGRTARLTREGAR
jgi:hypothetical protein